MSFRDVFIPAYFGSETLSCNFRRVLGLEKNLQDGADSKLTIRIPHGEIVFPPFLRRCTEQSAIASLGSVGLNRLGVEIYEVLDKAADETVHLPTGAV